MKQLEEVYQAKTPPERPRRDWLRENPLADVVRRLGRATDPYVHWSDLFDRSVHAGLQDVAVFREVYEDRTATLQAFTVVLLVAFLQSITLVLLGHWCGYYCAGEGSRHSGGCLARLVGSRLCSV